MVPTLSKRRYLATLAIVALLLIGNTAEARDNSPGRPVFEQAYKHEEGSPAVAIILYRRALALGLNEDLRRAARWRLLYLYKNTGDFPRALAMLPSLGRGQQIQRLRTDIEDTAAAYLGIPKADASRFYRHRSIVGSSSQSAEAKETSMNALRELYNAHHNNNRFRNVLFEAMASSNNGQLALQWWEETGDRHTADYHITRADLLLSLKRFDDAQEILDDLASEEELTDDRDRARILYMFARLNREQDRHGLAAQYFRLAGRYAPDAGAKRMQALAAFSLYRIGEPYAAHGMLRHVDDSQNEALHLLQLILKVEVDQDREAYNELAGMREILRIKKRNNIHAFLAGRALELVERR